MISLLFLTLFTCSEPIIVNHTKDWTKLDQDTLIRATKRCGKIYPDAPCVKTFIKTEPRGYQVICGEEK